MRVRMMVCLAAVALNLMVFAGAAWADPGAAPSSQAIGPQERLLSIGYTPQEASAKLEGLTAEEQALVAQDPSLIQVGGIDSKQGATIAIVAAAFFILALVVY